MKFIHRPAASVLFTIVIVTLSLGLIYVGRRPLITFIFAILFAYLLDPLVARFQGFLRGSRGLAIATTYVLLGIAIAGFAITAGPRVFTEARILARELPALMENVGSGQIAQQFGLRHGWDAATQLQVQRFLSRHRDVIAGYAQRLSDRATGIAGDLMWLLLIPILALFLLKDHALFAAAFLGLIRGNQERGFLRLLLDDLDAMLATFIRAQVLSATLSLAVYTSFLLVVQFPYAFALAAIAGFLEFIPFVGPVVTFILILGMAALTGYPHWLLVLVFLVLWRVVQDYVISPYFMSRGLKLHPLAVIFGVLLGGEIAGIAGLFLSVPIIAGLRIIWKAWGRRAGGIEISHIKSEGSDWHAEDRTHLEATQRLR